MLSLDDLDRLICRLATMDRTTLVDRLGSYPSRFPVDLAPDFLAGLTADRIRHLFFAICVQNGRLPEDEPLAAAA